MRPVYFSTTVSPESLSVRRPYLVRVGMLNEVSLVPAREAATSDERLFQLPQSPELIYDVPRTDALIWQVYRYGNLLEPDVYKDPTTVALTTNLRITLLAMARIYAAYNEEDKARRAVELATRIVEAATPS